MTNDPEGGTMYLTAEQARTLTAARRVLEAVREQAVSEGLEVGVSASDVLAAGRLAEAADLAEDAVFNTLNTAASMCGSPEAQHAIRTYRSRAARPAGRPARP